MTSTTITPPFNCCRCLGVICLLDRLHDKHLKIHILNRQYFPVAADLEAVLLVMGVLTITALSKVPHNTVAMRLKSMAYTKIPLHPKLKHLRKNRESSASSSISREVDDRFLRQSLGDNQAEEMTLQERFPPESTNRIVAANALYHTCCNTLSGRLMTVLATRGVITVNQPQAYGEIYLKMAF
jgi:hypothetical protein